MKKIPVLIPVIVLFLFLLSPRMAFALTFEMTPDPAAEGQEVTLKIKGCSQNDIKLANQYNSGPVFAIQEINTGKQWYAGKGEFGADGTAIYKSTQKNANPYNIRFSCAGSSSKTPDKFSGRWEPTELNDYVGKFYIGVNKPADTPQPGNSPLILSVPVNQKIVTNTPVSITMKGLQSCPVEAKKNVVLIMNYDRPNLTDQKRRSIDYGSNDEMTIIQSFDIGDKPSQRVSLQLDCGSYPVCVDTGACEPPKISNKVVITVLSKLEAEKTRVSVSLEPNPPYVNEKTTMTATGFNESGCADGSNATFKWKNTETAGQQQADSGPIKIVNNKIVFSMPKPFDNEVQKELWVVCKNKDNSEVESFPHVLFAPVKRVGDGSPTPSPIPSPIFPPCVEGVTADNKKLPLDPNASEEEKKGFFKQIVKCTMVDSAIGSISTDPKGFILKLFQVLLGLSGGIALLLIIRSGYKYMTSQGNPETTKAAQEEMTSAIVGLLFLIFSLVILQIIGVDLLKIPGLGQ